MAIVFLPTGDPHLGRTFCKWEDEFRYAMGADFDFDKVVLPRAERLVLNVICVDPARGAIQNRTVHKRSSSEFWTSYNVEYAAFASEDPFERLKALKDSFIGAVDLGPRVRRDERGWV